MNSPANDESNEKDELAPIIEDTRVLRVSPIQLVMHLNNSKKKEVVLTYDMIKIPNIDPETKEKTPEKPKPASTSKYPYFTNSVKYPKSMLLKKGYEFMLQFFFDKDMFEKILKDSWTDYVNEEDIVDDPLLDIQNMSTLDSGNEGKSIEDIKITLMDNTEYNIMTMLRCIFLISPDFGKIVSSSYRQYIRGEFNMNIFSFNLWDPFKDVKETELCLKINGKDHLITDAIWLNDTINHPIYREFVKAYNVKIRERAGYTKTVNLLINDKYRDLALKIEGFYTPPPESSAESSSTPTSTPSNSDMYTKMISDLSNNKIQSRNNIRNMPDPYQNTKNEMIDRLLNRLENAEFIKNMTHILKNVSINPKTKKPKVNIFTDVSKYEEFAKCMDEVANVISLVYGDIYQSNSSSRYSGINLSADVSRTFNFMYTSAISVKTAKLIKLFITGTIPQFDLKEKNKDGSSKPKEDVDVIRELKENYTQYIELSNEISDTMKDIYPPVRESSNFELQGMLKSMKEQQANPTTSPGIKGLENNKAEIDFFKDIYAKYITGTKRYPFNINYMYTGVNTISTSTDTSNPKTDNKTIMKEIHLVVDVIDKKKYLNSKENCTLKDDVLTNEFLYLINFDNLYQVNPYRLYEEFEQMILEETPAKKKNETKPADINKNSFTKKFSNLFKSSSSPATMKKKPVIKPPTKPVEKKAPEVKPPPPAPPAPQPAPVVKPPPPAPPAPQPAPVVKPPPPAPQPAPVLKPPPPPEPNPNINPGAIFKPLPQPQPKIDVKKTPVFKPPQPNSNVRNGPIFKPPSRQQPSLQQQVSPPGELDIKAPIKQIAPAKKRIPSSLSNVNAVPDEMPTSPFSSNVVPAYQPVVSSSNPVNNTQTGGTVKNKRKSNDQYTKRKMRIRK